MKKNCLFIGVATLALMASCSKESVVDSEITKPSNAIGFSSYKTVSRGNPVDDNTEFMTEGNAFGAVAYEVGATSPYMGTPSEGIRIVAKTATPSNIWDYSNPSDMAYWPAAASNFIAYYPYAHTAITNKAFTNGSLSFDYAVPATEAEQVDVMFATALDQTKPAGSNMVKMPFKHALTQVHFKIATKTARLKVDVAANGITIYNIKSIGKFTIPTVNTDNGWTNITTPTNYVVTNDAVTGSFVGETTKTYTQVGSADKALILIPQTFTAWTPAADATAPAQGETGAYVKLSCKIYQMLADGTTKQYLVGSADTFADVYIPFSSQKDGTEVWNRSKKVTYNMLIGAGNTLLDPIMFETEVEAWVDADGGEIENQ
ncbi:MAG: fimbrillin family protein [Oscillospiraceae bacterium]